MYIIGGDQGLLPMPFKTKNVLLMPAERTDIIFDFTELSGRKIVLKSETEQIVEFRVKASNSSDESSLPPSLQPMRRLREMDAVKVRRMTLDEATAKAQESTGMTLNKTPWHAPITEKPVLGTTEIWELVNLTEDVHPVHLHLVRFQVLDRRSFDVVQYKDKNELVYTAPPNLRGREESGWKDTVRCEKGQVTRIIVPFDSYTGRYLWHSQILEHEDNEMMRPFEVVAG